MRKIDRATLRVRALWELLRYDVIFALRGLRGVSLAGCEGRPGGPALEAALCEAVLAVIPLYWKPVHCLQRSMVTARLMRRYGLAAEVVIGYRAAPFFGHAWVEIGGRVVNDSSRYQRSLEILERRGGNREWRGTSATFHERQDEKEGMPGR